MDRLQEAVDKLEEEKLIEITIPNVRFAARLPSTAILFSLLRPLNNLGQEIPENRTIKYNLPGHGEIELQLPEDAEVCDQIVPDRKWNSVTHFTGILMHVHSRGKPSSFKWRKMKVRGKLKKKPRVVVVYIGMPICTRKLSERSWMMRH